MPQSTSLVRYFLDSAAKQPSRPAVRFYQAEQWQVQSYAELAALTRSYVVLLQEAGVARGDAVVLPAVRHADLPAQLLAILWLGAHYVFIDPELPAERQTEICRDVTPKVALGNPQLLSALPLNWIDTPSVATNKPVPEPEPADDLAAYVMFTSGSTGRPKGVVVPQRAIKRLVIDTDFIAFESQAFLLHSALSFDASTLELWGGLLNSGTCVMFPQEQVLSPASLRPVIKEQGVTTLWLTASVFNWLIEEDCSLLAPLQQVLTGGEALSVKHVCEAVRQLPNTRIFNGYGPTENTTFSTVYPIPEDITVDWESVPIGWPISGTDCAVLNADNETLTGECEGQLVVTGSGLAMGYLNQPALTEKAFIRLSDADADGESRPGYLTGDLVRRDAQGCFYYLGRIDKQVKIEGRRIEPGEIESALKKMEGIKDARVVALATPQGSMRLVAYWTGEHEVAASLRGRLLQALPRYCVPHFFVQVERFPVTQNGKLDVQALPCPFEEPSANAPQDDIDGLVEACWRTVLGREVERHTNFLDAGGTSLEALKLAQRLSESVGRELPATFVFEFPTIQAQTRHFDTAKTSPELDTSREREAEVVELAVVGMACRFPGANNVQEFWQNLTEGRESIRFFSPEELSAEVPAEEYQSPHYVPAKGVIEGADCFDAAFFGISPAEARLMDPQHRLMLQLAWHALEDAGYAPAEEGLDAGIYVGANWGRYYQQYVLPNKAATNRFGAFNTALLNEPDFLSTRLSYKLNLRGPSVNVYTACSTGLVAVAEACAAIVRGDCQMALAGGVSVSTPLFAGYRYQEGGMLSEDGHCRPFDAQASGTTFNDGAGFVVLKRLDQALRDGDNIYACVKGYAVNNDGSGKASYTAPSVSGQVAVYREALKRSGVSADTIGFIETHGTATPLGDPIEVAALKQVYQSETGADSPCALGSVKSNIGHVIHAAGIASFIKTCLSVKHGIVPATLHFSQANPKLELDSSRFFVNAEYCSWPQSGLRRAAVSSLGVGGTNAHVIIEQVEQNTEVHTEKPETPVLYLSAKSEVALKNRMSDWVTLLQRPDADALLRHQCYAMARQPAFDYRCATTASSAAALADQLNKNIDRTSKALSNTPKKTGLLFTGQGAQRPGMGAWLYQQCPEYRESLDHSASILLRDHRLDLLQALNDMTNPELLNQTALTQPALFILEWALAKHVLERGAHVDFLIGHSIGEYAAAVIAGIMEFDDALRLVIARGTLMQSMPRGAMLAVKAEPDEVAPLLTEGLVIAAINGPKLVVLAGLCEKIDAAETLAARSGLSVTRLKTSHAFHSPMMDDMLQDFAQEAAKVRFSEPHIAIFSTLTGKRVEREMCNADYWVQQVRQPVQFSAALCNASDTYSDEELALIEVGPGNTLTSLALMHSLANLNYCIAAAPDALRSQQADEDINSVLTQLWQHGFKVNRGALFKTKLQHVPIPLYPFDTQRFWLDQEGSNQATEAIAVSTPQANTNLQVSTMSASNHREQVSQKLLAVIEDITGYELGDLDPETHFNEAGLDSLLLTQVAIALDQQFGGNITFRDLVEQYNTLEALCDFYVDVIPAASPISDTAPVNSAVNADVATSALTDSPGGDVLALIQSQLQLMQQQLQALTSNAGSHAGKDATSARVQQTQHNTSSGADLSPSETRELSEKTSSRGTRIARNKSVNTLSGAQLEWVTEVMLAYEHKFAGSKAYAQAHRKHLADPRTVSGFNPDWKEAVFQIVVKASKGSRLWDIDGNELLDITNGFGPILFGHSPDFVNEAVKLQIDKGIETGPQSPLAGEVAELFCELTGNERCSFASTGSEAVVGAIRLARTVTGRKKVVMFEGAYHGIFDEVIARAGKDHQALPAAPVYCAR